MELSNLEILMLIWIGWEAQRLFIVTTEINKQ